MAGTHGTRHRLDYVPLLTPVVLPSCNVPTVSSRGTEEEVAEREATERDRGISATPSFGTQSFDRPTTFTEDRRTSLIVAEEPFWHDHHRLIGSENRRVGPFGWPTTTGEQRVTKDQRVPLRDRCSFGRFPWLISQALSVTYMAGERRLYLERNCRLPESPAHSRRRNREGPASSKGLNSQRGFGPAVEPRRKSRPRSTSLHGSSPCKCQRLSTLRWDRLPPSRPSTKSGARAGGRRLSDRRLHRWLAGTSASAPSSHGAADLLGLNRAHICVRNRSKETLR